MPSERAAHRSNSSRISRRRNPSNQTLEQKVTYILYFLIFTKPPLWLKVNCRVLVMMDKEVSKNLTKHAPNILENK